MNRFSPFDVDLIDVRSAGQAVTCLNQIYALGGTDNSQTIHGTQETLSEETVSWAYTSALQTARMDFGATVISDSVMVGGGMAGEPLAGTEFYRPELDTWQSGPGMLTPRYGHQYLTVTL